MTIMKKWMYIFGIAALLLAAGCDGADPATKTPDGGTALDATRLTELESYFYDDNGQKTPLQRVDGKYYVVFYTADREKIETELAKNGAEIESVKEITNHALAGPGSDTFTDYAYGFIEADYEKIEAALPFVLYWSPLYSLPDGAEIGVTEVFTVVLPRSKFTQLEALAEQNHIEMFGWQEGDGSYTGSWYNLACTVRSAGNALQMANLFYETGLFDNVFPGWLLPVITGDTEVEEQDRH